MIKSSWFYVKFKHAEKVRTAPAAALRRALLGLSCSPSPGSAPGSVTGNRFSWGSRDKAVPRAADEAATSARCRWKRKAEISFLQCHVGGKK